MLKIAKRINISIILFEYLVLLLQDLSGCITSDYRKNDFIIGCSGGLVMISDLSLFNFRQVLETTKHFRCNLFYWLRVSLSILVSRKLKRSFMSLLAMTL